MIAQQLVQTLGKNMQAVKKPRSYRDTQDIGRIEVIAFATV